DAQAKNEVNGRTSFLWSPSGRRCGGADPDADRQQADDGKAGDAGSNQYGAGSRRTALLQTPLADRDDRKAGAAKRLVLPERYREELQFPWPHQVLVLRTPR